MNANAKTQCPIYLPPNSQVGVEKDGNYYNFYLKDPNGERKKVVVISRNWTARDESDYWIHHITRKTARMTVVENRSVTELNILDYIIAELKS